MLRATPGRDAHTGDDVLQLDSGAQLLELTTTGFWLNHPALALVFELEYTISFEVRAGFFPRTNFLTERTCD